MKRPSRRFGRMFAVSAMAVTAAALMVAGVTSAAVSAQPQAGPAKPGPGYPPPGGIYQPFTNCPLLNPLMQESLGGLATGCVAGNVTSGSITIGNIVTPVVARVKVQFGIWNPPNASAGGDNPVGGEFAGGILPPPSGLAAMLVTRRDLIPQSLTTALGCPSTDAVVQNLCDQAANLGGKFNKVYALAQSAGQLTNFQVGSWTQRAKFKLINPLLGNNCYIGSDNDPIVLNPELSIAPGGKLLQLNDPDPVNTRTPASSRSPRPSRATLPSPRPGSPAAARAAPATSTSMRRSTPARACPRPPGSTA